MAHTVVGCTGMGLALDAARAGCTGAEERGAGSGPHNATSSPAVAAWCRVRPWATARLAGDPAYGGGPDDENCQPSGGVE